VYGLNQVLTAIGAGAAIVVERSPLPTQMVESLESSGATVLAAVPPLWAQLVEVPALSRLRRLRVAQNAGGHLPPEVVRRIRAALPETRLFLQYGMTETFRGTYLPPEEVDGRPGSMGRAMPDTEILVVDEQGRPVRDGEVGELVHRGPTIAAGYWNDPVATAATFRAHPMRPGGAPDSERVVFSGDLVRRDADGYLYFVGRRDRMIKTMGFRVGPDEVADVLHASGEIRETMIDAEADADRGERIIAYIVLRDGGSAERLERFCRAELPPHAQPSRYVVRHEMPRLPSGKYDLAALRQAGSSL
jgi:acyl-CoA synthetase (AMP-forming)/AMP-acid ligase II